MKHFCLSSIIFPQIFHIDWDLGWCTFHHSVSFFFSGVGQCFESAALFKSNTSPLVFRFLFFFFNSSILVAAGLINVDVCDAGSVCLRVPVCLPASLS